MGMYVILAGGDFESNERFCWLAMRTVQLQIGHMCTHVWQHQLGYPVRLRGALRIGLRYDYRLGVDKSLADYNMEAQGDVLADYVVLRYLGSAAPMRQPDYANQLGLYERVLAGFLADPASRKNLPKSILLNLRWVKTGRR